MYRAYSSLPPKPEIWNTAVISERRLSYRWCITTHGTRLAWRTGWLKAISMYGTCIRSWIHEVISSIRYPWRHRDIISRYARLVDVNQFFFFFKLRDSNKFDSKVGAIRSAVSECKNERYARHYYPLLCEVLRYVTTEVWLPCFTLYEFTRALRFAIEREARFLLFTLPELFR